MCRDVLAENKELQEFIFLANVPGVTVQIGDRMDFILIIFFYIVQTGWTHKFEQTKQTIRRWIQKVLDW